MTEAIQRTDMSDSSGDGASPASRVSAMFSALDNRDFTTMSGFLAEDVVVHFGNTDPVVGLEGLLGLFDQVMSALKSIRQARHPAGVRREASGSGIGPGTGQPVRGPWYSVPGRRGRTPRPARGGPMPLGAGREAAVVGPPPAARAMLVRR